MATPISQNGARKTRTSHDIVPPVVPAVVDVPNSNTTPPQPAVTEPPASRDTVMVPSPAGPVAQPPTAQASIVALPADDDFGGEVATGFEGTHSSDDVIPMLQLMQPGNPQVVEGDGSIRAGDIVNSVTGKVWKGAAGFTFVPCYYHRRFVHWNRRKDKGGNGEGFIAEYTEDDPIVVKALAGRERVMEAIDLGGPPGNATELVETKTLFGLIVDGGEIQAVAIPCTSSKLSPFNKYVSSLKNFRLAGRPPLPLYAHTTRITTRLQQNKAGPASFNFVFEPAVNNDHRASLNKKFVLGPDGQTKIPNPDGLFEAAREFHEHILSGKKKAAQPVAEHMGDVAANGNRPVPAADDDGIPF